MRIFERQKAKILNRSPERDTLLRSPTTHHPNVKNFSKICCSLKRFKSERCPAEKHHRQEAQVGRCQGKHEREPLQQSAALCPNSKSNQRSSEGASRPEPALSLGNDQLNNLQWRVHQHVDQRISAALETVRDASRPVRRQLLHLLK